MVPKAEDAAVVKYFLKCIVFLIITNSVTLLAQDIPENELDARINTYFDNFKVTVIYPQVTLTKKLSNSTSVSARYLSDIISSASMRMNFPVDGITSATTKKTGGADNTPDEWRHEFGLSFTQKISEGIFSLSGNYSTEHDYSSKTFLGSIAYPFAKKNTVLQIRFLKSLDKVFPQVRTWTRDRNTWELSGSVTQILSKNIIAQIDASYIDVNGYMLDGYQVIRIIADSSIYNTYEPVEPDRRFRRAIGIRTNIGVTKTLSLQLGYRYYWDSWDIKSNTISATIGKKFSDIFSGTLELRHYFQTKAFFFKPVYVSIEQYMTVDQKLNSGYTDEGLFSFVLRGKKGGFFIHNEKMSLTGSAGFYRRYTDSPDWISNYQILYAYLFSLGIRYNF
jgi:hypothetical protein